MTAAAKTIKVKANYPFCEVSVGDSQELWGISFEHIVRDQKGEEFHFLVADMDIETAKTMFDCGRVGKFE